ncbi:hypothetical protein SAMN04490182_4962 [Pseudomonas cedrina]|uniref:Uncharacterized protein n=1 Tax=Pseudomonas cedrina TaxID=651740 RepID=A0ABY0V119_PSECE|nr:hypothetical protein SAMN04490182_4962 [Pseudomonas cedrina]
MIGLREDQQMKARMIDFLNHAAEHCGSWLACDGGVSSSTSFSDPPLSQASQLPHWTVVEVRPAAASAASKAVG